eukprot:TRINITY_DN4143_c0_g1_i1.p1 TRINITY_DN4143_c0_g1~~TRINITY_DN4143_c0_g1_i1.p1  ORF type:complete len:802 (-),score=115.70 TRINITY_DN4143_c0_g1_i1:315-2720(-)
MLSRRGLLCASPACNFEVHHARSDFGGFCCRACFSTEGRKHGCKCEKRVASKGNATQTLPTSPSEPQIWVSEEDQLAEDAKNLRVLMFSRPQSAPHLYGVVCDNSKMMLFRRAAYFMQEVTGHHTGTPDGWKDIDDDEEGLRSWWWQNYPSLGCGIAELVGRNGVLRGVGFGSKVEDRKRAANLALALTGHFKNPLERSPEFATVINKIRFQRVILTQNDDAPTQCQKRPRCSPAPPACLPPSPSCWKRPRCSPVPPACPPPSSPLTPFEPEALEQTEAVSSWDKQQGQGENIAEEKEWHELSWVQLPKQTQSPAQCSPQLSEQAPSLAQSSTDADCILDWGERCGEQAIHMEKGRLPSWLQLPEQSPSSAQCPTDPDGRPHSDERIENTAEPCTPHQQEQMQKSLVRQLLDGCRNRPALGNPPEQVGHSHPASPEAEELEPMDPGLEVSGCAPAGADVDPLRLAPQPKCRPQAPRQRTDDISIVRQLLLDYILDDALVDQILEEEDFRSVSDLAKVADDETDAGERAARLGLKGRTRQRRFIQAWQAANRQMPTPAPPCKPPPEYLLRKQVAPPDAEEGVDNDAVVWHSHLEPEIEPEIDDIAVDAIRSNAGSEVGAGNSSVECWDGDEFRNSVSRFFVSSMPEEEHDAEISNSDGQVVEVPISKVYNLQDNISERFKDGTPLCKLIEDLKQGAQDPMREPHLILNAAMASVPTSSRRHAPRETFYWTYDHRRFYCMQQAGCATVRLRIKLSGRAVDELFSKARDALGQRSSVKVNSRNEEPWARHGSTTWAASSWAPGP